MWLIENTLSAREVTKRLCDVIMGFNTVQVEWNCHVKVQARGCLN